MRAKRGDAPLRGIRPGRLPPGNLTLLSSLPCGTGVEYGSHDVLKDAELRQGIKDFTCETLLLMRSRRPCLLAARKAPYRPRAGPLLRRDWPTIPQVFVDGEFVVRRMCRSSRLRSLRPERIHVCLPCASTLTAAAGARRGARTSSCRCTSRGSSRSSSRPSRSELGGAQPAFAHTSSAADPAAGGRAAALRKIGAGRAAARPRLTEVCDGGEGRGAALRGAGGREQRYCEGRADGWRCC